jgi:hypothetical protein
MSCAFNLVLPLLLLAFLTSLPAVQSCSWLFANLADNLSAAIDVVLSFSVSLVREKLSNIAFLPLLWVVVVTHYPWLYCCCFYVACDIVAAGQSGEWWTTSDAAASMQCLSLSVSRLPSLICYNKTTVKKKYNCCR